MKNLLLVCACLLTACGSTEHIERTLSIAAQQMMSRPDSALHLLSEIDPGTLGRGRTRARYALLYTQALDKNYIDTTSDSLLSVAYRYYRHRPSSDSVRFLLDYHYGRIHHNAGDCDAAIPHYLTAERFARNADIPYFSGLVYTRLGEIYSDQLNFTGMLEYYRKAHASFTRVGRDDLRAVALINLAWSHRKLKQYDAARACYEEALELTRKTNDTYTESFCLSGLGVIYGCNRDYPRVRQLVERIRQIAPDAMTIVEYQLLSETFLHEGNIDSARICLHRAEELAEEINDQALNKHLVYRIERATGDYPKAFDAIEEFFALNDSITWDMLRQSSVGIENRFYRERSAFADYRLKVRSRTEFGLALCACAAIAALVVRFRRRTRKIRLQIAHYTAVAEDLHRSKEQIRAQLERKQGVEQQLKRLVLTQFDQLDRLCFSLYERGTTKAQQEALYREVRQKIRKLADDAAAKAELEEVLDIVHDGLFARMRAQFPKFKESDFDLLRYIYAGFSAQVISVLTGETLTNVYTRKSRLRARIAASQSPDAAFFLEHMP